MKPKGMRALIIVGLSAAVACARQGVAMPASPPLDPDALAVYQYAAMHGDDKFDHDIIDALQASGGDGADEETSLVCLYCLSVLGDRNGLPAIDDIIENGKDAQLQTAAQVAKARLIATDEAKHIANPDLKAATVVRRFLGQLGLTVSQINSQASGYLAQCHDTANEYHNIDVAPVQPSLGYEALNQLADMVYRSGLYSSYMKLPEIRQINWSAVPAAEQKIKLAPLNKAQRIAMLIDELDTARPDEHGSDAQARHIVQLLADEGDEARSAVSAAIDKRLQEGKRNNGWFSTFLDCTGGTVGATETDSVKFQIPTKDKKRITHLRTVLVCGY